MLNMLGHIDQVFRTHTVTCINYAKSDYNDDGVWEEGVAENFSAGVNLQPINKATVDFLTQNGGTVDVQQTYTMHLNNGNQVYHERKMLDGTIQASEVIAEFNGEDRKFRVIYADNRPWHNQCIAHIEMLKNV